MPIITYHYTQRLTGSPSVCNCITFPNILDQNSTELLFLMSQRLVLLWVCMKQLAKS